MQTLRYSLILVIVSTLLSSGQSWIQNNPEDDFMEDMMTHIDDNWDQIVTMVTDHLGVRQRQDLTTRVSAADDTSKQCQSCLEYAEFITGVLDQGYTLEEIRPLAMVLCYNYVTGRGWDGDIMCDGVIDNYLVHLVTSFNETSLTAPEICQLANKCLPENASFLASDSPVSPLDTTPLRPHGPIPQRRKVSLNETIKVVHVTDIHSDAEYDTGSATECSVLVCCRDEWPGSGYAGPWGSYDCNIPGRTVDAYLQYLSARNPDIVLYTGDTSASIHWLETLNGQINQSQVMAGRFAQAFPGVPVFTTIGNHEMFPTNIYHVPLPDTDVFNREFALAWQSISNLQQEQLDTMATGGYYSVEVSPGLRLLSYNSNFQAIQNFYVIMDQENNGYGAMQQFMEDTFDAARLSGEKVLLIAHHASGRGDLTREYSEFITDITRRNSDLIVLHLVGHSHRDRFNVNIDPVTGEAYDYQMSIASMASSPMMNPSARLLYLHPDTLEVLDMDTFYLDIQDPSNNSTGSGPLIEFGYRYTEEYGMVDCTPASMKDLIDRMEADDTLLAKYRSNYETRTGSEGPCDADCKAELFCYMRTTSYTQYLSCLDTA